MVVCSQPVALAVCPEDTHTAPEAGGRAPWSVSSSALSCRAPWPLRMLLTVPEPSVCALLGLLSAAYLVFPGVVLAHGGRQKDVTCRLGLVAKKVSRSITHHVRKRVLRFDKVLSGRDVSRSMEVSRQLGSMLGHPELKEQVKKQWLVGMFSLEDFGGQADCLWIMPGTFIQGLCFHDLSDSSTPSS